MFADALLDSHHQSRRGWATLTSFGIQAIFIACLLILPLLYTQVLPRLTSVSRISAPPLGENLPVRQVTVRQPTSGGPSIYTLARNDAIVIPTRAPIGISSIPDPSAPEIGPISNYMGPGTTNGVLHGMDKILTHAAPPRPVSPAPQQRVSRMMEGSLINRVEPVYPPPARSAHVQGTVILAAVIGTDGSVQKLQVVSGNPLLVQAAINAVSQWRYRPYLLNGSPIEVDTRVTVNFILSQ